jgi:hypothetical protein
MHDGDDNDDARIESIEYCVREPLNQSAAEIAMNDGIEFGAPLDRSDRDPKMVTEALAQTLPTLLVE